MTCGFDASVLMSWAIFRRETPTCRMSPSIAMTRWHARIRLKKGSAIQGMDG